MLEQCNSEKMKGEKASNSKEKSKIENKIH